MVRGSSPALASKNKGQMRYSVSRRKPGNDCSHVCEFCGTSFRHSMKTVNRFCCIACSASFQKKVTLEKFLCGEKLSEKTLKRCVLEVKGRFCSICGVGEEWAGKPLTLQLDHIDGNSDNDLPINLRVLCPNCHSQTETYGSKGSGNKVRKDTRRNRALRKAKGYVE